MKKLAVIATALLLFGCALTSEMKMGDSSMMAAADYPTLAKQAKAAIKKAKAVGSEWRDSGKYLKKAKAAHKAGKDEKAIKLAKKAKFQGEMGQKQAAGQSKAGPWLF